MQSQGSLQENDLGSLLQVMQAERATGTLFLEQDDANSSLYFLFGHLFHAEGSTGKGEEVVVQSLGWNSGTYTFDPRAKLPQEETISASSEELIAQAQEHAKNAPLTQEVSGSGVEWTSSPEPTWAKGPEETSAEASVPVEVAHDETVEPEENTGTTAAEELYSVPDTFVPVLDENPPHTATPQTFVSSDLLAYPVPLGTVLYEHLKSSFIDFPRLLATLKSDAHTGYLRLYDPKNPDNESHLLFLNGDLVEALSTATGVIHGEDAFIRFRSQIEGEVGLVDVVEIDAYIVTALSQFYTGQQFYSHLMGRFIDFPALLAYLEEQLTTGHVLVTGGSELGIILLREGKILCSYTENKRIPDKKATLVSELTKQPDACIEVRTSSGTATPLNINKLMGV